MASEITIIVLGLIALAQLIERHFYTKEMNRQLGEATRAILSRNVNEFMSATAKPTDFRPEQTEPDEVELSTLSDEEFDKAVSKINK